MCQHIFRAQNLCGHHHHHSEHGQGLGLKTCSFEAQGVPCPSNLLSVFPYPAIPEVGTGRPALVGGFYLCVQISFNFLICRAMRYFLGLCNVFRN
jgi:hypothetical protein